MTRQLYKGLKANKVNFEEDYQKWQKGTMIEKIATVMGVEFPYDPDESYVLTVDNLIKILAIQMRFRSVNNLLAYISSCMLACLPACLPSDHNCLTLYTPTYTGVVSQWSSWERQGVERQD